MCDEREMRDYATGSRFFVAAPGSRSEEERRSQRTAWLERYLHHRPAVRFDQRSEA
jgi:hypothetical protein